MSSLRKETVCSSCTYCLRKGGAGLSVTNRPLAPSCPALAPLPLAHAALPLPLAPHICPWPCPWPHPCPGPCSYCSRYVGTEEEPYWSCALAGGTQQYSVRNQYLEATTFEAPCPWPSTCLALLGGWGVRGQKATAGEDKALNVGRGGAGPGEGG